MKTYTLSHPKTPHIAVFTYREDGLLIACQYPEQANAETLNAFISQTIRTEQGLLELNGMHGLVVREKLADLSFDAFWNAYTYKVGAKAVAEKLWTKLSDEDKTAAIIAIKPYDRYIARTGVAKIYPERYIKYRRWENEF